MSDWIVPGHGPKFKVTNEIRLTLERQNKGHIPENKPN